MIREIISTVLILLAAVLLNYLLNYLVDRRVKERKAKKHRGILVKKTFTILIIITLSFAVFSIWGIDTNNVWIFLTSILALIAIGFFAVWSILSNILAGLIFFFTGSIRIGDEITIYPEKISGMVIEISSMFVILQTKNKNTINIPNNMLFQRVVKKKFRD